MICLRSIASVIVDMMISIFFYLEYVEISCL